ncbi:MAG TPA: TonB-dependent receptor [Candidatus Sulfotelmatobacter sp.]|nr:TonB-dependent receptor [Candidatus Sulfotelmatobacter sp.]
MKFAFRSILALLCLFCAASVGSAQSTNSGDIRGTVMDSSGAAVVGATVTLSNIDTGEVKEFITNGNGIYDTVSTRPGNYTLTFSKEGFKKTTHGPIVLQVSIITVDATLEVGKVTETITVEDAGAPLLQTESGQQGTIMEAKTLNELPQIGAGITGNDWANFNIFLPGASSAPSQPSSEGSGAFNAGDAISINGNLPNYANFLADGATVVLPVSGNVDNSIFESISEVQITTSSFSAQYGIGGAVFNQISKSGSNTFHGSAYEYWQNDVLNARPYFSVPGEAKPSLRYNEWGGSVGGPIIKNKLFFFFVRDKISNNGSGNPHFSNVPTLAERGLGTANPGQFDFSGATDSNGNPITIYDPTSCNTPGCTRTAFAGNIIPANRIDPVALKVLSSYPMPNAGAAGAQTNNFFFLSPSSNPNLRYFGRIDYDLMKNNRLTFSITAKNNPGENFNQWPCPINCFSGDIDGYNVQLSDTWTFSSTFVNEFRMGYTKQGNWFVPQSLGFDSATTLGLQYAKADIFPTFNINGVCCTQLSPGTNAIYIENLYDPSDVVTLIKGRHILHFGVEVLMGQGNTTPWGNVDAGQFTFNGSYTQQNCPPAPTNCVAGGTGFADFLLGDVNHWTATNQAVTYMRIKDPQLFVQDDYKVLPNLTVNLGLRYEATTGMSELHNAIGGFDPNLVNPLNGTLGSMWFGGQIDRTTLQKPVYNIFLPRVGFAWSPTMFRNTTIRAGFGMYSYNFSEDTYGQGLGAGSIGTSKGDVTDPLHGTGPLPLISLSASAATAGPILQYVVGSPAARQPLTYITPNNPQGVTFTPYNVPVARINEWTISVEHQFAHDYAASIAYVGSAGSHLQFPTDLNQITDPTVLAAGPTTQAQRPFPDFGSIGGNNYNAISRYNSLQFGVTKRYSYGLTFQANYVWSHFLDEQDSSGWGSRGGTQNWQVGNNPSLNYGNSNFDIPNAFKGIVSYELPFGQGKQYLNHNTLMNAAVGGWRISGTFIAQSGNPFTVIDSNSKDNNSQCGNNCTLFLNEVSNPFASIPVLTTPGISYFNPAAFTHPTQANFAFGTVGRNTLRGPDLKVINLSLAKEFHFKERYGLQLRADFVNALNHPSFEPPQNDISKGNFGIIDGSLTQNGTTVAPRSGQLSARFSF